ncbi:MAG: aminopeptidase P N-terminal domain-containing protein [Pseudomonadota bacterium]|nr:aminopeptidase P N-terminal domain-containing protein [Pseudomonadota bacterium]
MSTEPRDDARATFQARRTRVVTALGGDAMLVFGAHHQSRNGDSEYRYRQSSDLWYLSGWEDPESAVLLRPGADHPFVMFVQPKDRSREVWTGFRAGLEGARERFGADAAFPWSELGARLPELLAGWGTLHYAWGEDGDRDRTVFRALSGLGRVAPRNGLATPHQLVDARRLLGELRLQKDAAEVALLRRAADITAEAHVAAMRLGRPGVAEYEVEAEIDGLFRRRGGNGPGYTTIVGGGTNACVLHYITNREPLRAGDLCLVDAGCEYANYTADVTRTWPVSGRFSAPQRRLYEIVLASQIAAIDAARAGRPYKAMHDAAVRVLTEGMVDVGLLDGDVETLILEEGFRRYYMHGTGHWLGLDVHDPGAYHVGGASRALQPGMVVTVEPGLYVAPDDERAPAAFRGIGIRIEDDILVTEGEPDVLTAACPKSVADVEAACGG